MYYLLFLLFFIYKITFLKRLHVSAFIFLGHSQVVSILISRKLYNVYSVVYNNTLAVFDLFIPILMFSVMWSVTTCSLVQACQHPIGTCWTDEYRTTRHCIPENSRLNFAGNVHQNLISLSRCF